MLPMKHPKEPLGKGWEAHPTAELMEHEGTFEAGAAHES